MRLTEYTQNQRLDALKIWLVTGNLAETARSLNIPYPTLKEWRYSKWWMETAEEIKAEGRMGLSAKLRKIAEKSLDETLDRLENGDVRLSPTGEKQLIPVSAAVAAKITTDFMNKAEELDRVQEGTSLQTVNDRLLSLATAFEKFSKKVRRIEVEDAQSNGSSAEEDSRQEEDVRGEGERLHLRYDEKDGMDTFDAESKEI